MTTCPARFSLLDTFDPKDDPTAPAVPEGYVCIVDEAYGGWHMMVAEGKAAEVIRLLNIAHALCTVTAPAFQFEPQ